MLAEDKVEDDSSVAYRTNMPLARLQLRKAEMIAGRAWGYFSTSIENCEKQGMAALQRLGKGQPYYAEKGKLTELAYVTANDETVQPYYVHLPEDYDPSEPWPLIVFLHGYVPTISILDPWVLSEDMCQVAEDNDCVLLIPYGRRNTDFEGVGEVDVLASTEEVKSLYNIDDRRVYISGVSMGGRGAWNMLLRHPGMYAAATPITGQTDMHTWWPRVLPQWPASRDDLTPFRRMLVEWDNPIDLVMNARNQPVFLQHGELDNLIPITQSRRIVAKARELAIPIKFGEFKGEGHYIYWDLPCFKNAWSWTRSFKLDPSPTHITYKTYSLEYDTSFWVQIADFVEWGKPATVDCRVTAKKDGLDIECSNVRLLKVDVVQASLKSLDEYSVTVNGKQKTAGATAKGELYIVCDDTAVPEREWPPRKRKGMCGPVEEVFDDLFLLVVGTAGDAGEDNAIAINALQWVQDWDGFADGLPNTTIDSDVTDEDIATHNLLLFGTPKTNSVLAKIADKLPITIGDHEYTVAGKTYSGDDLGLVMCFPNPLAPDRYVAIYSGALYGKKCGINHKHDLIPDFIVFRDEKFSYDDTNEHVVAGYFNMDWELDPDLTWVAEEE